MDMVRVSTIDIRIRVRVGMLELEDGYEWDACTATSGKNRYGLLMTDVLNKQNSFYINFGPIFMPTSSPPAATFRLRSAFKFPLPFARTNKFQSFINYGLRWYQ